MCATNMQLVADGCARVCECPRTVGIEGPLTGQWRILAERCITLLNLTLLRLLASPSRRLQGKGGRWALSRPLRRSKKLANTCHRLWAVSLGALPVGRWHAGKQTPVWTGMLRWRGLVIGKMICLPITAATERGIGGGGGRRQRGGVPPLVGCCCVLERIATRNGTLAAWANTSVDWARVGGGQDREVQRRGRQGRNRGSETVGAGLIWGAHFDSGRCVTQLTNAPHSKFVLLIWSLAMYRSDEVVSAVYDQSTWPRTHAWDRSGQTGFAKSNNAARAGRPC